MGKENQDYYNLINKRLPQQLQNLTYIFFKRYVKYNEDKSKPLKNPLSGIKWADIKANWNETYLNRVSEYFQTETRYNEIARKHYLSNQLNLGLVLDFTDLLVLDVDNAEETFKQLEKISQITSEANARAISTLLELFNNTFAVTSGNGGFHYYFKLENKSNSKYNTRYTKCLKLKKLLDFTMESVYNSEFTEHQKLDFDLLGTGNIILPPSEFYFKRTKNKKVISVDWEHNNYTVHNDCEIITIDEYLLDTIFDISKDEKNKVINKKLEKRKKQENPSGHTLTMINNFKFLKFEEYSEEMKNELAKDSELNLLLSDYEKSPNNELLARIEEKKNIWLKTFKHDHFAYEFFYDQLKINFGAYNDYLNAKTETYKVKFFTNLYTANLTQEYSKKLDHSSFEYGFIKSLLIRNLSIELIWTIIKYEFLEEARISDRNYFDQLVEKVRSDITKSDRVTGNKIYHKLTNFSADCQWIDYPYYFKGSASSVAKIFQALVERALKIASVNKLNPRNNFHLKFESLSQISLLTGISLQTTARGLKKLEKMDFIKIRKINIEINNADSEPEIIELDFLGTIEINRNKKFRFLEPEAKPIYTPELLPELSKLKGVGHLGSILFTMLFESEYAMDIKEIYKLFPSIKNRTTTIKPKLNLLVEYGFVEFDQESKTYKSSQFGLATKLKNAKDLEYKKSMLEFISKVDPDNIPDDITKYKVRKRIFKNKELRIPKLKPINTFSYYSKKYSESRDGWNAYKKKQP